MHQNEPDQQVLCIYQDWLENKLLQEHHNLELEFNRLNEYEESMYQIYFEIQNESNDEIRIIKEIEYDAVYTRYIGATYVYEEHEERFEILEFILL